jgi:septal ring factor EnvC (AmiA/AmiB activator)
VSDQTTGALTYWADKILLILLTAVSAIMFLQNKSLKSDSESRQKKADSSIASLEKLSASYRDSAKVWRDLAKDCDLTVDSLNQVLQDIGKKKLQVKRNVESASDTALIRMFYDNMYSDEK